jgi:hypothetical protein
VNVAFIVHHIECGVIIAGSKCGEDVGEVSIMVPSFLEGMAWTRMVLRS